MSILPKDYKEPVVSNYMKFEQGENMFRILSPVIVGMEFWKTEKNDQGNEVRRPIRRRQGEEILMDELEVNSKTGDLEMPKHFWAMIVWNYQAERIQILEITQSSIRKPITALEKSKAWGDAREYDISVTRSGEGFDTEYSVMPCPKEPVDKKVAELCAKSSIDLEALYLGVDPFAQDVEAIFNDKEAKDSLKQK